MRIRPAVVHGPAMHTRHDIDARATQDFKEASDYFTSRKVSESGSHTDNNADSRVDQLSAAPELSKTELRPVHDEYDPQP
ncbi:conjugative transfer protein [Escherichia coli]|uniref:Conjugative transfer protein n=1 Tax=Escherichia coli TaxID=562 RepID=A0A484VM14_ECOLX|nr:conjugative transfer protein [Escherichia coli]